MFSASCNIEGKLDGGFQDLSKYFEYLKAVFTDNKNIINTLTDIYGLDKGKFFCHYQPLPDDMKKFTNYIRSVKVIRSVKENLNILWASRIDREKCPDILLEIIKKCIDKPFIFHIYGSSILGNDIYTAKFKELSNVRFYRGF